jgi:hypothetical protein
MVQGVLVSIETITTDSRRAHRQPLKPLRFGCCSLRVVTCSFEFRVTGSSSSELLTLANCRDGMRDEVINAFKMKQ